jgi:HEAT repeat protein
MPGRFTPCAWGAIFLSAALAGCAPFAGPPGRFEERGYGYVYGGTYWYVARTYHLWEGGKPEWEAPPAARDQDPSAGPPPDIDWLSAQLASPDPAWRDLVAAQLAALGPRAAPAVPALVRSLRLRANIPNFATTGAWMAPEYAELGYYDVQATRALACIGMPAVDPLIQALEDPSPRARAHAACALGKALRDKSVLIVPSALHGPSWPNPVKQGCRLGGAAAERAAGPLRVVAKDQDPTVRGKAAEALGRMRRSDAVPLLIAMLSDKHPGVRGAAAKALGAIGDRRAVPALIEALADPSHWVPQYAETALRTITGRRLGSEPAPWRTWWRQSRRQPDSRPATRPH